MFKSILKPNYINKEYNEFKKHFKINERQASGVCRLKIY